MDYKNFSGEAISEQDKAFAQEFANFVNGRMCSADKTGKELTKAHRYLQQQMFKGKYPVSKHIDSQARTARCRGNG